MRLQPEGCEKFGLGLCNIYTYCGMAAMHSDSSQIGLAKSVDVGRSAAVSYTSIFH